MQQNEEQNETNDNVVFGSDTEWNDNDDNFSVQIDHNHNELLAVTNESLLSSRVIHGRLLLAKYAVVATDQYIKMEIDTHHNYGEPLGGFRSACWRSRYPTNLFGRYHISDIDDAKFIFDVTKLNLVHIESMNDTLYRLLGAIKKRWNFDYLHG